MSSREHPLARLQRHIRHFMDERRRKAAAAREGGIRRLERRRVMAVAATFNAGTGVLDVDITAGGNTIANLLARNATDFFLDADNDLTFDAGEATDQFTDLRRIVVDGIGGPLGTFFWRDNFAAGLNTAPLNFAGSPVIAINNVDTVQFDSSLVATAQGDVQIQADDLVQLGGNLTVVDPAGPVQGSLDIAVTGAGGQIQLLAGSTTDADGTATLAVTGNITLAGTLNADDGIDITATGANSDIVVQDDLTTASGGAVTLQADDAISFSATGSISAPGAGNVSLTANADALLGDSGDGITLTEGSVINAGSGTILLSASGANGGDIALSSLSTTSVSANAIQVVANGAITDNTVAETANLTAASGTIRLTSATDGIGAGVAANDIDIQSLRLVFNAATAALGIVQVTDLGGGLTISGASTAGGGGAVRANSPLTISANITVGASTVFTAGDSAAAGDDLTIESGAIVELASAVAGTLTFNAGDDIVLNTGQIITTGGGLHGVVLAADLDNAGVGAGDGDRGGITQDGSAAIDVATLNLTASAAEGIDLDTTVGNLSATNTATGNIRIDESDGIALVSVTTADGSIEVNAAGAVTAISVSAGGAGSNATLTTTTGGIAVTSVSAANDVILLATAGDITSGTITATAGLVDIEATAGDVTVGSITAGTTVTIDTPAGSINDATDDALVDITAGGLITLTARDEIAGAGVDGKLDLAAGSEVIASSAAGTIALRGLGDLILTSVTTGDGPIIVMAAGTITATLVDATGTDSDANDVTLMATGATSDVIVVSVLAGPTAGDVIISADRNIVDGDTGPDELDISGQDVTLTAVTGNIGEMSADVFICDLDPLFNPIEVFATGALVASAVAGNVVLDVGGTASLTITAITALIQSDGDLDVTGDVITVTNLGLIADADNNGLGTLTIPAVLTVAGDLRVEGADVVAADGSIDLVATRVLFASDAAETIGVTADVLDATSGGSLVVVSLAAALDLLDLNCDNVALQSTGVAGSVTLTSPGTVTISDDVIAGNDGTTTSTGSITITASGAASSIIVNDVVLTDAGDITLRADDDIRFGGPFSLGDAADTDNLIVVTTATGNVLIEADANLDNSGAGGAIFMADGTRIVAGRDVTTDYVPGLDGLPSPSTITLGAVALGAGFAEVTLSADEDITLGSVQTANATADAIRVTSRNGGIVDGGDSDVDLVANNAGALVTLRAVTGIGSANALETAVFAIDAATASGPAVAVAGNIRLNEIAAGGDLNLVQANNTAATGAIVVEVDAGALNVVPAGFAPSNGLFGVTTLGGNILLSASDDIVVDSDVVSTTGHITLLAGDDIDQNADIITGGTGTVFLGAGNDTADAISGVDMAAAATITTAGGDIRIVADNEGDILLAVVDAGAGNVSLLAERSILDNNGAVLNITATNLRMVADAAITNASNLVGQIGDDDAGNGTPAINVNAIDVAVTTVAARSADGIYLRDINALVIGASGAVTVQQVNDDGTITAVVDASLAGMATSDGGPIKVVAEAGSLTVDEAVTAGGAGDVLLEARGLASDVIVNAAVSSGTGHITLRAGDDIDLNAALATAGAGTVFFDADNGTLADAVVNGISVDGTITTAGGDILLDSARDIVTTAAITSTSGDIGLVAARNITQGATVDAGTGDVLFSAGTGTITLGLVEGDTVALSAGTDILDGNVALTNVRATEVSLRAGGTIGMPDLISPPGTNNNAIDLEVTRVAAAAATGIYLREVAAGGSLTVDRVGGVSVGVTAVNFNSTTSPVATALGVLDDLTTTAGPVKVVVEAGTLTVNDGLDGDLAGVSAGGTGNILLEARGAASDVVVNATVTSGTGHITLRAGDDIDLNAALATAGAGTVFFDADNGTLADAVVNGISVDGTITTAGGDILLDSARDIVTTAAITSTSGDIGLVAARNITQGATVDAGTGDVLFSAGTGTITLGLVEGDTVALSAGTDILDGNVALTNVRATEVSLRAGGTIGMPDLISPPGTNNNAIDLEVTRVAAAAATGIYLREVAAGGSLTVDRVGGVSVGVTAVNFNSTTSPVATALGVLDDLTTTAGPVKVVVEAGTLTVNDGLDGDLAGVSAGGTGNILLEARGAASDVVVNATVTSGTGHITLRAGDDIDLNAALATAGAGTVFFDADNGTLADAVVNGISVDGTITTATGDILLDSARDIVTTAAITSTSGDIGLVAARNITQGATVDAGTGDVLFSAGTGTITLGLVEGDTVALNAGTDILDGNVALTNVRATEVSLRAGGTIGMPDLISPPGTNNNAIDLEVTRVAAAAATGIYLREVAAGGSLTVDRVSAVSVDVTAVNFNSTTSAVSRGVAALDDLTTTAGPVKVVVEAGTLTVNDGLDGDGAGVTAGGAGNVLLEARGLASDVVVNASVTSGTGHVTLRAGDDIDLNAALATGGAGTVLLDADNGTLADAVVNGISIDGTITTAAGDILLDSAGNIGQTANITSTSGDVGLSAAGTVSQTADTLTGANYLALAGGSVTMGPLAEIDAGTSLLIRAGGVLTLGYVNAINVSLEGTSILDGNGAGAGMGTGLGPDPLRLGLNVEATNARLVATTGSIGATDLASAATVNTLAIDLDVTNVAALATSGIYLHQVAGAGSLTVGGTPAVSVTVGVFGVQFRSTVTFVSLVGGSTALSDLTTTAGPVKVVNSSGSIVLTDGFDADGAAVVAGGSGNILLDARGAASDVLVNAAAEVTSGTGHISLRAGDDVHLLDSVSTLGAGSIHVRASNGTADAAGVLVDGINVRAPLSTGTGDILFQSTADIRVTAGVSSATGEIGLAAADDVELVATITSTADIFVAAGGDVVMGAAGTVVSSGAGGDILVQAGGDLFLNTLTAAGDQVSLGAGGDIVDINAGLLNITASRLAMSAGGAIGAADLANAPDSNFNAIDVDVDRLAAFGGSGIHVRQVAAGGDLRIDNIPALTVTVSVLGVDFRSTTTAIVVARTQATLDDLQSTAGPVKIVVEAGSLVVTDGLDGDAIGVRTGVGGDILLEARGAASDIIVSTGIVSISGDIALVAGDDIDLNGGVSTGASGDVGLFAANGTTDAVGPEVDGININAAVSTSGGDILVSSALDIRTTALVSSLTGGVGISAARDLLQNSGITGGATGDILVLAGRDIVMSATAGTVAQEILVDAGRNIALGLVSGTSTGRVSVRAAGDITDANGAASVNILADELRLEAGGTAGTAAAPLGTEVGTVAALAADGIHLRQRDGVVVDNLEVGHVDAFTATVSVDRPRFNSSTTTAEIERSTTGLDDLTTTAGGDITVVADNGTITVNDGTDGDGTGVSASGAGLVRLEANGVGSDVLVNAALRSGSGAIVVDAADDIELRALVATAGDVSLLAGDHIDETTDARVVGDLLTIDAGTFAHLHDVSVNSLSAAVGANGTLDFQVVNSTANDRGDDFLSQLGSNLQPGNERDGTSLGVSPADQEAFTDAQRRYQVSERYGGQFALFLVNDKSLNVGSILAGASDSPNLYVETTGLGNLAVSGSVATASTDDAEGGIVLVAGGSLSLTGSLSTLAVVGGVTAGGAPATFVREQWVGRIDLVPVFFDGGEGIEPDSDTMTSTKFVKSAFEALFSALDFRTHVFQRVALQFGRDDGPSREAGFESYISYADGAWQRFQVAGHEFNTLIDNELPLVAGFAPSLGAIPRFPAGGPSAAVFERASDFTDAFLDANQVLPTLAIIRRADDFFLFESAGATDLAVRFDTIDGVLSEGTGGGIVIPPEPPSVPPLGVPNFTTTLIEQPPFASPTVAYEPAAQPEKTSEVAIWRVDYDDRNLNGQVDADEVPGFEEVKRQIEAQSAADGETDAGQAAEDREQRAAKVTTIAGKQGASPTPEELAAEKQKLLNDPAQPSDPYAIVERDLNGNVTVRDVFPLRDFEEDSGEQGQRPPMLILPAIPAALPSEDAGEGTDPSEGSNGNDGTDGAANADVMPASALSRPEPVRASAGLIAGSLWLLQQSRQPWLTDSEGKTAGDDKTVAPVSFTRSARRSRRLRQLAGKI